MINKKKISIFLIILIILLMFTSCINAMIDYGEAEVKPVNVTVTYKDHNTTKYEGDRGLEIISFTDELTGMEYTANFANMGVIRTLAYMTKRQFKFNDTICIRYQFDKDFPESRSVVEIKGKDGKYMALLDESRSDLSDEEKSYFDNYDDLREEYLAKQSKSSSESHVYHESSKKKSGFYYGSHGLGYYRSF
ncbi:hypothetical protein [Methanosphaera cuniculi]|uniref:Lipoprotein n=1 Tax=Methanosphaera cuniculi TaxID=1077256 RepID=A0A2A2HFB3_9EURY|nr:hypothetical protein [Methanosphaera cuniculi]PAV08087.1 hypothetical protein ASJ82_01080 [Methanosphaera cuniculi]PWL07722.1 hypothetical protein MSCUN_12530 [Methanosphaera cuniculi]